MAEGKKPYVTPTIEITDKPDNNFFVRLCYGYVEGTLGEDTSKMTTRQVVQEFLDAKGVSSPKEFFDKKFNSKNKLTQENNKEQENATHVENPKEIKSIVPKANTIKEAEQMAKKYLGIEADYNKFDLDVANALNEQISKIIQFCPNVSNTLKMTGSAQSRNKKMQKELEDWYIKEYARILPEYSDESYKKWAKSQASKDMAETRKATREAYAISSRQTGEFEKYSGIFINDEYGRDSAKFNESKAYAEKSGQSPIGAGNFKGTINHELGHQLTYALDLSK